MRSLWKITIILWLSAMAISTQAETRLGLINKLRDRIGETDTLTSIFSNAQAATWAQQAQDKVVRMGGYLKKYVNIVAVEGLGQYALPTDFKYERGVKVKTSGQWIGAIPNPQLLRDTSAFNYDVWWVTPDVGRLYVRGPDIQPGDTIRVEYYGRATALTLDASPVEIASDDQVFVVEEMIAMYLEFKANYQVMLAKQQQTRTDMGVVKQVDKQ